MTERKPAGTSIESWVEQQIRRAQERGEFDDLPGAGKPIPGLNEPYDEMWWVKGYARREGLSTEATLPEPLQLRKEIARLPETVRGLPSEQAVRDVVAKLNRRIVAWLRAPSGPQVVVRPVDVDDVVRQWHTDRQPRHAPAPTGPPESPALRRRGWWRPLARRGRKRP